MGYRLQPVTEAPPAKGTGYRLVPLEEPEAPTVEPGEDRSILDRIKETAAGLRERIPEEIDLWGKPTEEELYLGGPFTEPAEPQKLPMGARSAGEYAAYAPYLAVKAVQGFMAPALPALKAVGVDTEDVLQTAAEYWREKISPDLTIPNYGIGLEGEPTGKITEDLKKLRIEKRPDIPAADLLGETAGAAGFVAGPVRAGVGAGRLAAEKTAEYARPFFRNILAGMIGGALLGEGEKDQTLANAALFGIFEGAIAIPRAVKNTTAWRKATVRERGLMVQSLDDMLRQGELSEAQILKALRSDPKSYKQFFDRLREQRRPGKPPGAESVPPPPQPPKGPPGQTPGGPPRFRLVEVKEKPTRKPAETVPIGDLLEEPHVAAAAIQLKDGSVVTGRTHHEAWDQIPMAQRKQIQDADGFVDQQGRYLTRAEAVEATGAAEEDAAGVVGRELPTVTVRMKDGTEYQGTGTHLQVVQEHDLDPSQVADTGILDQQSGKIIWGGGKELGRGEKADKLYKQIEESELLTPERPQPKTIQRPRARKQAVPKTVRQWVRQAGGVNPQDPTWKGELDDIRWQLKGNRKVTAKGFPPGFWNRKARSLDDLAARAVEEGILPPGTGDQELMDAIREDRSIGRAVEEDIDKWALEEEDRILREQYGEDYEQNPAFIRDQRDFLEKIAQEVQGKAPARELEQRLQQEGYSPEEIPPAVDTLQDFTDQELDAIFGTDEELRESGFRLKAEEPTAWEKAAELERAGVVKRPEKSTKAVFPKEGIKPGTGGKQRDIFEEEPQGELFSMGRFDTGTGYADAGEYASQINVVMDLPEIVQLAKELLQGKVPGVRRYLRKAGASGIFYPGGRGRIELRADIFEDPAQAAAVLAHEIGHLVDYLPDRDLSRGNILGRIAKLKKYAKHTIPEYPGAPGELTQEERKRLRRIAEKMVRAESKDRWIDEEIERELPISPEDVLAIWNAVDRAKAINPDLYEYVARLNAVEKKSIVKEALKGEVAGELRQFAKRVREKTGRRLKVTEEIKKEDIQKRYRELINEEIRKRKLFTRDEIMGELKRLTRIWKPFDPAVNSSYTKYRYSSPELYADAFSALINSPGLLKATAPQFYQAFFNYLEKNPPVQYWYDRIQDDIRSGRAAQDRVRRLREMFRAGDDAYGQSLHKHGKGRDLLARELIDANWFVLKPVKKIGERNVPAAENPRYKLENLAYSGSEAEELIVRVYNGTVKPLEKAGLTWEDLGEYVYHLRVSTERAEKANPQGWHANLSKKRIQELKNELGDRFEVLERARKEFRKVHESVIEKMKKARTHDPGLIEHMEDMEYYATFDVVKYINQRYGFGPGPRIFRQVGTLEDIANPATATLLKDISMVKSVNRQIAGRTTVKFLQKHFSDDIQPADRKWNGRFNEIREPRDPRKGLIVYLRDGKAQGYYVDKYIAQTFERNPVEAMMVARVLSKTIQPFRMAFVELNYGFWMFNLHRDYFRAVKNLPGSSILKFAPYWLKGIRPAYRSVFGIPDPVISEMRKNNMLISVTDVRGLRPEDKQIERMLKMYHLRPRTWKAKVIRPVGAMFTYMTNIGRVAERTPKVAGYRYLKKKFPDMPIEELAHKVRTRAGSPDFLRLGRAYPIYNNLLMFSNAMKEGYRGDYEAMADTPAGWWWKQAKYTLIPKLLMYAGAAGLLGIGIQKILDGASEYDKTNYIIIPLGVSKENGKPIYLRIPMDETGRFVGGVFWKLLNHEKLGWGDVAVGLFDYMAGQAPTVHPGVGILVDIIQYASGRNPYDWFRGRYVLPEQLFEAHDARTHKEFLKYLADQSGAGIVYEFKHDDIDRVRGELEEFLEYPFVSNILGRFVKVSDAGVRQDLQRAKERVRRENARKLLDAKESLAKLINGEPLNMEDVNRLLAKPDVVDRNAMVALARKHGWVYLEQYLSARSNKEKAAVLDEILQKEALNMGRENK